MTDATPDRTAEALEIAWLAAMDPVAYDHTREQDTKDLGIRASAFDGWLGIPGAVKAATAGYFTEQDTPAHWLAERCEAKSGAEAPSSAPCPDWHAWAGARGGEPGTANGFCSASERLNAKKRTNAGVVFIGLRLLPSATRVF